MSLWSRLMTASVAGYGAFRRAWMVNGADDTGEFGAWAARRSRYGVLWSYYEGLPYASIQSHAKGLKVDGGLYKAIRSIYNPAGRLADFYATHLLGGTLEFDEMGGISDGGAWPILTDSDALRVALGEVMRASNWQIMKQVLALRGTVLGDAVLMVRDEVDRVYVENVHPASIVDVELDGRGYVIGYKREETRTDPEDRDGKRTVKYTETAEREADSDLIAYKTYRDSSLYPWNDNQGAEWSEPYGFVPMVLLQHRNVGNRWGWSEFHKTLSKIDEVNDQASKLSDQIRKSVDPLWLFKGVDATPTVQLGGDDVRTDTNAMYGPADAGAEALVAPLDIAGVTGHITQLLEELENDHSETRLVKLITSGAASGEAIRKAQQPVEANVRERRANYDAASLSAMLMAVSIAGYRGLVDGFNLDSYHAGNMIAQVGDRAVFNDSEFDQIALDTAKVALDKAEAEAAAAYMAVGLDPQHYLAERGWSDERVAQLVNSSLFKNATFAQYP